jgi:CrcB protein
MRPLFLVIAFGAIGVSLRYALGLWVLKHFPASLPWSTFAINVVGAFLMGMIYVLGVERSQISPELRMGLTVGLLGGFTTFSAYCMEAIRLWEGGAWLQAAFYYLGSPALGLVACYGGMILVRSLSAP